MGVRGRGPAVAGGLCLFLGTLSLSPAESAGPAFGKGTQGDEVKVEVERIGYVGKHHYRIEINLLNPTPTPRSLRDVDLQFYAQTRGGWVRLDAHLTAASTEAGETFPAMGTARVHSVVRIPLNLPGLFRTFEGDLSLMIKYRPRAPGHPETTVYNAYRDHYYWIKPTTNRWLLREGM